MTPGVAALALDLIEVCPFIAAAWVLAMVVRAVVKGEAWVGRYSRRKVYRSENPVQFWMEIVLECVVIIFFVLMGVLLTGHAPNWLLRILYLRSST